MLERLELGPIPWYTLGVYARYLGQAGNSRTEIHRKLEEFLLRCDPSVNLPRWQNTIDAVMRYAAGKRLVNIDGIAVTKDEIEWIGRAGTMMRRKLLFTMVCLARYYGIGGFKGSDIRDDQYLSFLKTARKYQCKVHCLGMTRTEVLDRVPFDTVDSRTWVNGVMFGKMGHGKFAKGKVSGDYSRDHRGDVLVECYRCGMQMQEYYYRKWKNECRD